MRSWGVVLVVLVGLLAGGPAWGQQAWDMPGELRLDAEYLLWAVRQPGQSYAILGRNPRWGPVGKVQSLEGGWDSGFRIGGGWQFTQDGWDVQGRYTFYHAQMDQSVQRAERGSLFATLTHPSSLVEFDHAHAQGEVQLHVVDLEIGKRLEVTEDLSLRVFAGPRYANLQQQLCVQYTREAFRDLVYRPNCFDGAGVRVGGETQLLLLEQVGLYARGSVSLLTGSGCARAVEIINGYAIADIHESYTRLIPIVDLGLGVSVQRGGWRVTVGYEFMSWMNVLERFEFADDAHPARLIRTTNDLGLDGLVLRAEWRY